MGLPILYSYRRCPYAIRARMALRYANIVVETREIHLRDKPQHMLACSPKGTVPVLVLESGEVIDESLEIMQWALSQHDPAGWQEDEEASLALIQQNDGPFKAALDRYKYAIRFPEQPAEAYRAQGEAFLALLEQRLTLQDFLLGSEIRLADVAIFPFIRQFSMVDVDWFASVPYPAVRAWLNQWLSREVFTGVMQKQTVWVESPRPQDLL